MKRINFALSGFSFLIITLLIASCGGAPGIKRVLTKQTPYEKYHQKLKDSGLDDSALGKEWIQAGEKALSDSLYTITPFSESGFFRAEKPSASGYRFKARRGEVLVVHVDVKKAPDTQFFIDLIEIERVSRKHKNVVSGDTSNFHLEYEVEEDQDYLIRLQPELLRGGQYTITVITRPALAWPVKADKQAIGSSFGVDRDGGRRKHEGIDIFAAKGTPAIASADGIVTRVNETRLGGKVVWITDAKRKQSLYYAHLDTQMVKVGQKVIPGDTIGLIGNTGNAITTPPHLHFGIYRFGRGAFDPAPYVFQALQKPMDIVVNAELLGNWARTTARLSNLRLSPSTKAPVVQQLPQSSPVLISGGIDSWFRVILPDGSSGFISSTLVETTETDIGHEDILEPAFLWDNPSTEAIPVDGIAEKTSVPVLAKFGQYIFTKSPEGIFGWMLLAKGGSSS